MNINELTLYTNMYQDIDAFYTAFGEEIARLVRNDYIVVSSKFDTSPAGVRIEYMPRSQVVEESIRPIWLYGQEEQVLLPYREAFEYQVSKAHVKEYETRNKEILEAVNSLKDIKVAMPGDPNKSGGNSGNSGFDA